MAGLRPHRPIALAGAGRGGPGAADVPAGRLGRQPGGSLAETAADLRGPGCAAGAGPAAGGAGAVGHGRRPGTCWPWRRPAAWSMPWTCPPAWPSSSTWSAATTSSTPSRLNSLLFNTARLVGPAAERLILPWLGAGLCFLVNGLSFFAVLAALAAMRLPPVPPCAPKVRPGTSLWAGFAYLARRPELLLLLALSAAMSFFGWPLLSLLPAVAREQLGGDTEGYSVLLSALGGGALVASLAVATFGTRAARGWFLGLGVVLAAAGLAGLALADGMPAALASCTLAGAGLILFFATSQAIMQLSSADHNRGRVMGIWSMVLSALHPLGHLSAGLAADRWGVPPVVGAEAVGIAAAAGRGSPGVLAAEKRDLPKSCRERKLCCCGSATGGRGPGRHQPGSRSEAAAAGPAGRSLQ